MNLDANPEAITFDTAKTAVLVVDMQNDFGSKGGMFDRTGIDISGIQKAVEPTAKVLAAARKAGVKIIYLKMGYKPDLSDLGAPDSVNRVRHLRAGVGEKVIAPDGKESRILIRDTWNTNKCPGQAPSHTSILPPCTMNRPPKGSSVASMRCRYSTIAGPMATSRKRATAYAGMVSEKFRAES